jgi:hypothetical protein
VLAPGDLMKMADVEALIPIAVQRQDALQFGHGGALRGRHLATPVEQRVTSHPLVCQPPPANAPRAAAEQLGSFDPREFSGQGTQDDLLHFHGALHSAAGIGHGHLLGGHSFHAARLERSFHVSIPSGHFTYPQHFHRVSVGTLSASLVHPREVFGPALRTLGVAALILVHNHPSGDPTFSREDFQLTRQLVEAGRLLDIPIQDHVVIGNGSGAWLSFSERGLL